MEIKLGVWTSYYMELDPEEAVKRLKANGIYAAELSDEHGLVLLERDEDVQKTGREFAAFLKENDFSMTQGHLWLYVKICSDETAIDTLVKWIELYEAIGIKNMVLHCDPMPDSGLSKKERMEKNAEKLKRIAEYIKGRDITICLENLRGYKPGDLGFTNSAEDLLEVIGLVGSPQFGICLDTGHLNLTDKDQRHFILTAGDRLKALHIADNRGETDEHLMPFNKGKVDFAEVVKALRQVDYRGLFNLEIPGERNLPLPLLGAKLHYVKACYEYLWQL